MGCFQSLTSTNSATMEEIPEVELLQQRVNVYNFATYANTPIGILPFFFIPTNNVNENSFSPKPHQA